MDVTIIDFGLKTGGTDGFVDEEHLMRETRLQASYWRLRHATDLPEDVYLLAADLAGRLHQFAQAATALFSSQSKKVRGEVEAARKRIKPILLHSDVGRAIYEALEACDAITARELIDSVAD